MNKLAEVLSQFPELEITNIEHDVTKLEIEFRVGSERWLPVLENITPSFPSLYFVKKYFTDEGRFGYRWAIILFGNIPNEAIEELASKFSFLLFESSFPKKKIAPKKQQGGKSSRVVTRQIVGEGDEATGEMTIFPIPHLTLEMNTPTAGGRGAYKRVSEVQSAWKLGSGGSWG